MKCSPKSLLEVRDCCKVIVDTGIMTLIFKRFTDAKLTDRERKIIDEIEPFIRLRKKLITPHILAETSHQILKTRREIFSKSVELIKQYEELNISANDIISHKHIDQFGVADIGISFILDKQACLLTIDGPLHHYFLSQGYKSVKYDL